MESMQAVILCGGLGTRLREETEYRPKPMVDVGGRPILWRIMRIFAAQGVRDFVLCLGYKGEVIRRYFLDYEVMNADVTIGLGTKELKVHSTLDEGDWRVTLVETGERAMTGARLARVQKYVEGQTFFLTYGDGLASIDLAALVAHHRRHRRIATITAVHPWSARFGEMHLEGHRVAAFREKPPETQTYINGGFFVLEPGVFDYVSTEDSCVLERQPLENLATVGQLTAYRHEGFWACMDTYRDWQALDEMCRLGERPWEQPSR
jgi:glucose-1-phosphate cytidylyltransferase